MEKVKTKRQRLALLYEAGMPFRVIAEYHGGTPQGVRSTVRKMVERGILERREQPQRGQW